VSEICGDVEENPETAYRRLSQECDDVFLAANDLGSSGEIYPPRRKHKTAFSDETHLPLIPPCIPRENFVMEMEIVTIWVDVLLIEWIDGNHATTLLLHNTVAGENHCKMLPSEFP